MSSTELQAAVALGGLRPRTGWRKLWGARRATRARGPGVVSPRFGPMMGLESQVLKQPMGPRRLPAPRSSWPILAAVGATVLLAAWTARWGWVEAQAKQQLPASQVETALPTQAGPNALGTAYAAQPDGAVDTTSTPILLGRKVEDQPVEAPLAVPVVATRVPSTIPRAASAPVPTLFLDEVAEDSLQANHDPVTLALFKATLPQRSADTDPLRHAAGAVTDAADPDR